jgi:hypothetical protein
MSILFTLSWRSGPTSIGFYHGTVLRISDDVKNWEKLKLRLGNIPTLPVEAPGKVVDMLLSEIVHSSSQCSLRQLAVVEIAESVAQILGNSSLT